MKKKMILTLLISIILSLYIGMALQKEHPTEQLFESMVDKINSTHVVKFKSGFAVNVYDKNEELTYKWQMKREGTYDAWSKYLNFRNVLQFENGKNDKADEKTSLSINPDGNMIALPISETYYKNNMYFTQDRESDIWTYQSKNSFDLLELLTFNSEVLNRYAKHYKSENRGKFVVFFFSVDPNYLTRTFSDILESDDLSFPYRLKEGTIKVLVYPDTLLPRRIYSFFQIENLETQELYKYNINTYFSEDETYQDMEEPAIPYEILQIK